MNSERDTFSITIRSRRVPVGTEILRIPYSTPMGLHIVTKRVVFYDYVLDGDHQKILREARGVAERTGARLIVSDLSREGIATRLLRRLTDALSVSWDDDARGLDRSSSSRCLLEAETGRPIAAEGSA
jgi:hypothetical protein